MKQATDHLDDLIDAAHDAVFTIDCEFRLQRFNPAFEKLLSRFGAIAKKGCQTLDWYCGKARHDQEARYRRLKAGELVEFTSTHDTGNQPLHLWNTYAPLRDETGAIYGAAGFIKDITPIVNTCRATEQSLVFEKGRSKVLLGLFQAADEAVMALDEQLTVVAASHGMASLLLRRGVTATSDFPVSDLLHARDIEGVTHRMKRVLAGDTVTFEKGFVLDAAIRCAPVYWQGRTCGIVVTVAGKTANDADGHERRQYAEFLSGTCRQMSVLLEEVSERISTWQRLNKTFPDPAFVIDRNDQLLYISPSLTARSGKATGGKADIDFWSAFDDMQNKELSEGLRDAFAQAVNVSGGKSERQTRNWIFIPLPNGNEVAAVAVLHGPAFAPKMAHCPTDDVKLREEVFGLSSLLFEVDVDGTLIYVNDKMQRTMGTTGIMLAGIHRDRLLHTDIPLSRWNQLWRLSDAGRVANAMVKLRTANGGHCWVDMTIAPVRNSDGKVVKSIAACYPFSDDRIASYLYQQEKGKWFNGTQPIATENGMA